MKRLICFFLLSLFLFSCSSAGTALGTATNTSAPPTAIPTITPAPTKTPTAMPVEKPITGDVWAWIDKQPPIYAKELGFDSWQALLDAKVYGPGYDTTSMRYVTRIK